MAGSINISTVNKSSRRQGYYFKLPQVEKECTASQLPRAPLSTLFCFSENLRRQATTIRTERPTAALLKFVGT